MDRQRINIESKGRFGTTFHKALVDKGMTLVEFARKIDANYEYLRKIFRGEVFPSKQMLKVICAPLKLDTTAMWVLITQDRMEHKVGTEAFNTASGRNSHASEFDALLPHLSEAEIGGIIAQMKAIVKHKRVLAKGA